MAERNERVSELSDRVKELQQEVFNESREDSLGELEVECEKLHKIIEDLKAENERLQETSRPSTECENVEELKKQIEEFKQKSSEDQKALKNLQESEKLAKKNLEQAEAKIKTVTSELEALQNRQSAGEEAAEDKLESLKTENEISHA